MLQDFSWLGFMLGVGEDIVAILVGGAIALIMNYLQFG